MYHVFQSTSCSGFLCRGLLRATPLSLRLGTRRYVFYRDTPCRKLLPEPLATQIFCLPRMVKLPLDYFSKHFACPLAGFVRAENRLYLSTTLLASSTATKLCQRIEQWQAQGPIPFKLSSEIS